MSRLEMLDGTTWEAFVAAPVSVLMLAKSDCAACSAWTGILLERLQDPGFFPDVRFGKMVLDKSGLASFKKTAPWLREVTDLPYNVIYVKGERTKSYAGGGLERLENRLRGLLEAAPGL